MKRNFLIKREQSQACLSYAECEKSRLKARLFSLLVLLVTAVTGAWATDDTTVFELNGSTASTGTLTLGTTGVEASTVKIHENTDDIAGIKMSNSYNYADGKYFTIKPATGSFKAGDKLSIAVCFNNADDTKNAKANIYAADGSKLLFTTAQGINGRTNQTDDPAVEEYVLTQDADLLYIGRNGNTATFVTTLKVVRPAASSGGGSGEETTDLTLSVGSSEHSTMKFYVGQDEVTKAKEGETVTIVVTPDDGWSIADVTGQWFAAMAKAPRRASIGLLQDVDVTFVSEDTQTGAHTYTFVMQRAKAEFNVVYKKHLDHKDIIISNILPVIYNAQPHTPSFTVKDGDKVLVKGEDYTVEYSNNTMAGNADAAENAPTVTIKAVEGHTFYVGENSKTFTIRKKTLEDGFMSKVADLTYNGVGQEPAPTLTYDGMTLVEGTDYVFSYINNKDAAQATDAKAPVVTASAVKNSNFTGAASQKFNIKKAPLTIKVADVNINFGSEVPQYEVSYEGFVNNETEAVLEGTLTIACDYTKESPAGSTFAITPSGVTAKNYDITFVAGKLSVMADQEGADKAAADAVIEKINAIGEVEFTDACKTLIDAAREAYDALTDVQKALVTNYDTLTAAETAYAKLAAIAMGISYSWESPAGEVIELGGTIAYVNGEGDRLNYKNGDYYTICLNGKKANLNDEAASANAGHMVITLDKALKKGDAITMTAYVNKNASKKASAYILFENGTDMEGEVYGDEANIDPAFNGVPTDKIMDVPEAAIGSKTITMTRSQTGTNLFITKLVIAQRNDTPTGIKNITPAISKGEGLIYNLNGQKVNKAQKGLFIINGKKVVIK